jgi:hypothetical protein
MDLQDLKSDPFRIPETLIIISNGERLGIGLLMLKVSF